MKQSQVKQYRLWGINNEIYLYDLHKEYLTIYVEGLQHELEVYSIYMIPFNNIVFPENVVELDTLTELYSTLFGKDSYQYKEYLKCGTQIEELSFKEMAILINIAYSERLMNIKH